MRFQLFLMIRTINLPATAAAEPAEAVATVNDVKCVNISNTEHLSSTSLGYPRLM
jgi:hypothetical protein